jgi:uncharacterized protein YidB (DUF937 family)
LDKTDGLKQGIREPLSSLEQVLTLVFSPRADDCSVWLTNFHKAAREMHSRFWVGKDENQPISGNEIQNALGSDQVKLQL